MRTLGWLTAWVTTAACSSPVDLGAASASHLAEVEKDVGCAPRACRVTDRLSVKHTDVAKVLKTSLPAAGRHATRAYRTGEATTIVPTTGGGSAHFVRVARDGSISGAALFGVYADAFVLAGKTPAEQLLGLHVEGTGAWAASLDSTTLRWGARHALNQDTTFHGQTKQVAAAPSLDGLRSTFAVGNRLFGPVDVGVLGADAALAAPVTRVCEQDTDCICLTVVPTETAGLVSMLRVPRGADREGTSWRIVALDATGKVVRDASVPISQPSGCPLVADAEDGPIALFKETAGHSLMHFGSPGKTARLATSSGAAIRPIGGLASSGADVLLLEYGTPPSVVRAKDGVIDESSRLLLDDAANDVEAIATAGGEMVLHYETDSSNELVEVSCR